MHIGCHLSFSKGYAAMGEKALELGADCFQFFSRNPRGGAAKAFDRDDALALKKISEENSFASLLVHDPNTFTPRYADEPLRNFTFEYISVDIATLQ